MIEGVHSIGGHERRRADPQGDEGDDGVGEPRAADAVNDALDSDLMDAEGAQAIGVDLREGFDGFVNGRGLLHRWSFPDTAFGYPYDERGRAGGV